MRYVLVFFYYDPTRLKTLEKNRRNCHIHTHILYTQLDRKRMNI